LFCSVTQTGKAHEQHPTDFQESVTKSQFQTPSLPILKCSLKFSYSCTTTVKSRFSLISFGGEKISQSHEYSCDSHFPGWRIEDRAGDLQNKKRDGLEHWTLMAQTAVLQLLPSLHWRTDFNTGCAFLHKHN